MKSIVFRPLRRIKKTGKITVASYMQWYKVRCANYSEFKLIVSDEYKDMPKDEYVYNHEGKLLFHYNYNPWEVFKYYGSCIEKGFDWDYLRQTYKSFTIVSKDRENKERESHHWRGADCSGTPTFTHWDEDKISSDPTIDINELEPLLVSNVIDWLGWFLYHLENSRLQIGK